MLARSRDSSAAALTRQGLPDPKTGFRTGGNVVKKPTLQQRVFAAVQSGQLVRTTGTPAEQMTDFELTRFLVEHTPEPDIEYYLAAAYHGARVEVSGTPAVRVAGEGLDGAPMDVTIYDGRPNGTRTDQ